MKIILKRFEYNVITGKDNLVTAREIKITDKNRSFADVIEDIVDDGYTVFYCDSDNNPKDIVNEGVFTYVLKNGHYEWYVSAEEVTVEDFVNTYGIKRNESITLVEEGIGGGDYDVYVNAIVYWIPFIIQSVGYYLTTKEIIKRAEVLYDKLIGRNKRIVSTYDFCDMLQSKNSWSMRELKSKTTIDDNNLIELLLMRAGFVKKGMRYQLVEKEELEDIIDGDNEIFEDDCDEWKFSRSELDNTIQTLNDVLVSLMIQSKYYKLDSYERASVIVNTLIEEWHGWLQRGKDLQFIETTDLCDTLSDKELYMLDKAVTSISEYISIISAKIDGVVID